MKPDRIRAIMRAKKLTCKMMAYLIGIPSRTMESYIQGRRNVPEDVALRIYAVEGINGI